jgi:hypothetical protein
MRNWRLRIVPSHNRGQNNVIIIGMTLFILHITNFFLNVKYISFKHFVALQKLLQCAWAVQVDRLYQEFFDFQNNRLNTMGGIVEKHLPTAIVYQLHNRSDSVAHCNNLWIIAREVNIVKLNTFQSYHNRIINIWFLEYRMQRRLFFANPNTVSLSNVYQSVCLDTLY